MNELPQLCLLRAAIDGRAGFGADAAEAPALRRGQVAYIHRLS